MVSVVRTDGEVGAGARNLVRGRGEKPGHALPIVPDDVDHVLGHRHRVHGYLRMIVLTHDRRRFQTNGAVTQRRTLRAACHDANVLRHFFFVSLNQNFDGVQS